VLIEEKPHALFERDGDDLHVDVPISFVTAALGGKVNVPTLDGAGKSVDVPGGTQSGRVQRLRGLGLPGLRGGRGDLHARLVVWVPTKVSGADKKLLEQLRNSDALKPPGPGKSVFERVKDAFAGS
jgi:molecular chaperone DnaJ